MSARPFQIALVVGGTLLLAPRVAAGQAMPNTLQLRLGRPDSVRRYVMMLAAPACPMPVVVPDRAKSERMPVAPVNPAPYAARVAPVGCINPLGPKPDTTSRRSPIP